jgi:hypothetical protein
LPRTSALYAPFRDFRSPRQGSRNVEVALSGLNLPVLFV